MIATCEQNRDRHLTDFDSYIRLIRGRMTNLDQTVELIKSRVKQQDEEGLIHFYVDSYAKIKASTLDSDLKQLKDLPRIENVKP